MSVWTIVVAAGSGSRFGRPKQFDMLMGRTVLDRSLETAAACTDGVVAVVPRQNVDEVEKSPFAAAVVEGGSSRSDSVRRGLAAVPAEVDYVLVHDAARPLASMDLYSEVIATLRSGSAATIPGIPVVDTLKKVDSGMTVVATVDRDELRAVQTPQGFRAELLRHAHAHKQDATDDAALMEKMGHYVNVIEGEVDNLKITVPRDLVIAEALMSR